MSFRLSCTWNTRRFRSGSPATTIRSAYFPGSTVPMRSDIRQSTACAAVSAAGVPGDRLVQRVVRGAVGPGGFAAGARLRGRAAHLTVGWLVGVGLVGSGHRAAGCNELGLVDVAREILASGVAAAGLA